LGNEERRSNRTERLFATILLLQNRPNMTSRDLSEHFNVSRRTIFRDLRALSESGVPLTYSEGGGYEILEGYQIPPLMLTAREAATLLVGTEFMKLQSDASLREDADAVALKIRTVLPKEIREYVDRLRESTVLDPYWLHAVREGGSESGRWYRLSEAVARNRKVIMEYFVEARGEVTRRSVDPLGLVYYSDHWNLIAFDHLRGEIRNFRLDRIKEMFVLSERFERPVDFDLEKHLEERGMTSSAVPIEIRFREDAYRRARVAIPARIESEEEQDGTITVRFSFDNLDYLASWILRFGDAAEVLGPATLREKHRKAAHAISDLYSA
jgi:predicted DNA-binding transcriptional regulator YafY